MRKTDILKEQFKRGEGFGVCGFSLKTIAERVAELYGSTHVKINVPYYGFNCNGTANKIAKDVCGLMPFSKKKISEKNITTLYYGDKLANKSGYYFPFQGECNVYFIDNVEMINKVVVINLIDAPSWRTYL